VGTGKSGTHSIATFFNASVRCAHEPEAQELIGRILDHAEDRMDEKQMRRYVSEGDRRLSLEVDSSNLNFFLLDFLLQFPKARFVLTIREPRSWLNSFFNHYLGRKAGPPNPAWDAMGRFRFQAKGSTYSPEERILEEHGLYSLDGYLSYWAMHNQRVVSTVPTNRLLVVRTNEITARAYEIADFAGLPRRTVRPEASHSFRNPNDFGILRRMDQEHVAAKIAQHCRPLLEAYFPEAVTPHTGSAGA
jgi:hypothetical protein